MALTNKIHTTIGVYNNGSFKINGVSSENLESHIEYNTVMRFGRALFVDGICIHKGYLDDKRIEEFSELFNSNPQYTLNVDTAPYH